MSQEYLRVTEVLKPFTGVEFVPEEILTKAANRGTRVHELIENLLDGFMLPATEEEMGYIHSFNLWFRKHDQMFDSPKQELEKRFFCNQLKITGQVDCIINQDDKVVIFDWKTSSRPQKKSWALQAAAYQYLAKQSGYYVSDVFFVRLRKDGKVALEYKFENYEDNLDKFMKCLELYRYFDMKRRTNENK